MAFWQWSKNSPDNGSADPSINFSEGQAPSTVNDSARAVMARAAEYRDDVSGFLTSGGIATAFTLATNQGLATTPNTGQLIAFVPNVTSGLNPTLACDGGTAFPIQNAGAGIPAGTLVAGTPYTFTFSGTAWLLRNFFGSPFAIPLGGFMPYLGTTAPNTNFALPFGQAISRTTYATLFAMIGTTFGAGDGTTTFNIPDLRGMTIAGLGNMGGTDAGRITVAGGNFDGTVLGATGGSQNHTLTTPEIPAHTHAATVNENPHTHTVTFQGAGGGAISQGGGGTNIGTISTGGSVTGLTVNNANTGGGGAHTILQPTMVLPMILRII